MADFAPHLSPAGDATTAGLVDVLLTLSPTAIMLLRPVYTADGKMLSDFDLVRLNPAAQQLLFFAPPGRHRLRLVDAAGRAADQVIVTIR